MGRFTTGVPDDAFERGDVPMTKREVRAVTLAYAQVSRDSRVLDIGAGTGGLTVELARACADGHVIAVERDAEALRLLRANVEALAPGNVRIVAGEAPEVLSEANDGFDAVVVGGHGGGLAEMLAAASRILVPGGRVVVNAIGLRSMRVALDTLASAPWSEAECAQVSIARIASLGGDVRLAPLNPVFVLAARLAESQAPEHSR